MSNEPLSSDEIRRLDVIAHNIRRIDPDATILIRRAATELLAARQREAAARAVIAENARLREAVAWLCTEMPVGWEDTAAAEGRGDVVEAVSAALADEGGET